MGEVIHSYRAILKHLRKLSAFQSAKSPLRMEIIKEFKKGALESNPEKVKILQNQASAYALMVTSNSELTYLLSLDTGDKLSLKEKVANTAARVGFSLPNEA